ncbi:hypothetical protein EV691_105175 [Azotobacter chroococcum]|uniref:Uncharacterized protein n=1 Tax=Azotobacter chroococcum TaxID=353 RepID=A0A4V6NG74_9GAMM|nr:hypothetical protein EV691_105175 [Azotobacter chroococcum]
MRRRWRHFPYGAAQLGAGSAAGGTSASAGTGVILWGSLRLCLPFLTRSRDDKCSHRSDGGTAEFGVRFRIRTANCPHRTADTQNLPGGINDRQFWKHPADELIDRAFYRPFHSGAGSLKRSRGILRSKSALCRNYQLDTGTERQGAIQCIAIRGFERLATQERTFSPFLCSNYGTRLSRVLSRYWKHQKALINPILELK